MKKAIISTLSVLFVLLVVPSADARQTYVKGYYRKDGTYVSPHARNVGGGPRRSFYSGSGSSYSGLNSSRSSSISSFSSSDVPHSRSSPSYSGSTSSSSNYAPNHDDPNYDSIMKSLKNCQALREDGSPCTKRALPGKSYCYLHVGYKPSVAESPKPTDHKAIILRNSELRIETLAIVDMLRKAIAKSMAKNGGVPPKDLAGISSATNDAWGRGLYYETDGKGYAIASNGPDGYPGTEDDINFLSNEALVCQAVLPNGKICGKVAETESWYCNIHVVKADEPDEKVQVHAKKKASGGGLRIVLDVALLLLAIGIVVVLFCWMSKRNPRRRG